MYLIFIIAIFVIGYRNHLSRRLHVSVCTQSCMHIHVSFVPVWMCACVYMRAFVFARWCQFVSIHRSTFTFKSTAHYSCMVNVCYLFPFSICLLFKLWNIFSSVRLFFLFIFVSIWKFCKTLRSRSSLFHSVFHFFRHFHSCLCLSRFLFGFYLVFSLSFIAIVVIAAAILGMCVLFSFLLLSSLTVVGFLAYRFLLFHYLCSFIACK